MSLQILRFNLAAATTCADIYPVLQNSKKRSLYFGEPSKVYGLGHIDRTAFIMSEGQMIEIDDLMKAYKNFIKDIAILLGADEDRAQNEMEDVFQFERKLAKFTMTQ